MGNGTLGNFTLNYQEQPNGTTTLTIKFAEEYDKDNDGLYATVASMINDKIAAYSDKNSSTFAYVPINEQGLDSVDVERSGIEIKGNFKLTNEQMQEVVTFIQNVDLEDVYKEFVRLKHKNEQNKETPSIELAEEDKEYGDISDMQAYYKDGDNFKEAEFSTSIKRYVDKSGSELMLDDLYYKLDLGNASNIPEQLQYISMKDAFKLAGDIPDKMLFRQEEVLELTGMLSDQPVTGDVLEFVLKSKEKEQIENSQELDDQVLDEAANMLQELTDFSHNEARILVKVGAEYGDASTPEQDQQLETLAKLFLSNNITSSSVDAGGKDISIEEVGALSVLTGIDQNILRKGFEKK